MTLRVVLAGGGTGGHVFPAIAVADALSEMGDVEVTFFGSPRGLETRAIPAHRSPQGREYALELLGVEPMVGGGAARAVKSAMLAGKGTAIATKALLQKRPDAVMSVGGYAAGPVALAAVGLRIPLAILEPNSVMGLTNRWLAPFAKRAYLAFPELRAKFSADVARLTGVPLRRAFHRQELASGTFRILVLGGSQGAKGLNARLPDAVARVAKAGVAIEVLHQAGGGRAEEVEKAYRSEGASNVSVVPFIEDVATELGRAHLVIARSGAGTLAEIAAVGRPSLLVPFPYAADDHQAKNAAAFVSVGASIAIREEAADPLRLANEIVSLARDHARLVRMAEAAASLGHPDAAREIAEDFFLLARGKLGARTGAQTGNGAPPANFASMGA